MKFNPNDYEPKEGGGGGGSYIPAGKHIVEVIDHEVSTTSGGYAQVVVTYTDGMDRTRRDYLICEGKAAWQFASLCHALGVTEEFDLDVPRSVKAALYNRRIEIVVGGETYQGKTQLKVKYRNKLPTGSSETSRATRPSGGGGYEAPPPPGDDDIPFCHADRPDVFRRVI